MLDLGRRSEEGPDDTAPLGECIRAAKINRVVFQRVPENHQHIALGRLDAFIDFVAAETFGGADDVPDAMDDGSVEFSLLAGEDLYVCEFEDHRIYCFE